MTKECCEAMKLPMRRTTLNLHHFRSKLTSRKTKSRNDQRRSGRNCTGLQLQRWWIDVQDCVSEDQCNADEDNECAFPYQDEDATPTDCGKG